MSDAIRCGDCRWWLQHTGLGPEVGECELKPPVFIGGDPRKPDSWWQPVTRNKFGCSRGKRRKLLAGDLENLEEQT